MLSVLSRMMTTMMMVMLKIPWLGLSCGVELRLLQVQRRERFRLPLESEPCHRALTARGCTQCFESAWCHSRLSQRPRMMMMVMMVMMAIMMLMLWGDVWSTGERGS